MSRTLRHCNAKRSFAICVPKQEFGNEGEVGNEGKIPRGGPLERASYFSLGRVATGFSRGLRSTSGPGDKIARETYELGLT